MFTMMKLVGDAFLLLGCIVFTNGARIILEDPKLGQHIQTVIRTGMLPVDVAMAAGGMIIFYALLIVGFGQLLYAVAHIAERMPDIKKG